MGFEGGWDRRRALSLRFVDPALEATYQVETAAATRRRYLFAWLVNIPLWALGGALVPAVFPRIDPRLAWGGSAIMITLLAVAAIVAARARSRPLLDGSGLVANIASGIIILALTVTLGLFDAFAPVLIVFVGLVGSGVLRLPFAFAAVCTVSHLAVFTIFAVAVGTGAPVQVLIVASGLLIALSGAYFVEDGERRVFAQARLIADLHRQVEELFRRYLSPDVAASLLANPELAGLGGEEVEVSVLFADLTGFTAFSERVRPEEAVAMLNEAFAAAVPVLLGEGGTIVQFAGDAVVAIFNAPVRQADHAVRAARAALALQRATSGRSEASATSAGAAPSVRPAFRVGLNTGPAVVGNIGSAELRSFTAIGDTINLAARIQAFAPPGSVAIGERTRTMLGSAATVRPLGTPHLKGKAVPVAVHELLALAAPAGATAGGPAGSGAASPAADAAGTTAGAAVGAADAAGGEGAR